MRLFLLVAAVVVGVANATLYSFIGNNTFDNLFEWRRDPWSLYLLYAFTGIFVGLLISGTLRGSPKTSCAIPSSPATA